MIFHRHVHIVVKQMVLIKVGFWGSLLNQMEGARNFGAYSYISDKTLGKFASLMEKWQVSKNKSKGQPENITNWLSWRLFLAECCMWQCCDIFAKYCNVIAQWLKKNGRKDGIWAQEQSSKGQICKDGAMIVWYTWHIHLDIQIPLWPQKSPNPNPKFAPRATWGSRHVLFAK